MTFPGEFDERIRVDGNTAFPFAKYSFHLILLLRRHYFKMAVRRPFYGKAAGLKEVNLMIPRIKKILFATDLSSGAYHAFLYAFSLAEEYKAKITILHVIEPLPQFAVVFKDFEETVRQNRQERDVNEIKRRLQLFCEKVGTRIDAVCSDYLSGILVPMGHPVEAILNAADEEGADVIILGSHGKGFMKQTFLGSVSRAVLERSRKPVLFVPLPFQQKGADWIEI